MDLAWAVFRGVGLSRHESAQLVESVLGHISDALVRGEQVKISPSARFPCAKERADRPQPQDRGEVPITPRRCCRSAVASDEGSRCGREQALT